MVRRTDHAGRKYRVGSGSRRRLDDIFDCREPARRDHAVIYRLYEVSGIYIDAAIAIFAARLIIEVYAGFIDARAEHDSPLLFQEVVYRR